MSSSRKGSTSPFTRRDISPVKMKSLNLQSTEKMLRKNQMKNQSINEELLRNSSTSSNSTINGIAPITLDLIATTSNSTLTTPNPVPLRIGRSASNHTDSSNKQLQSPAFINAPQLSSHVQPANRRQHNGFSSFSRDAVASMIAGETNNAHSNSPTTTTTTATTATATVTPTSRANASTTTQSGGTPKFQEHKQQQNVNNIITNAIPSLNSFSVFEDITTNQRIIDANSGASCFSFGNEPSEESEISSLKQQPLTSIVLDRIAYVIPSSEASIPSFDGMCSSSTNTAVAQQKPARKKQVSFCPPIVHCYDKEQTRGTLGSPTTSSTAAAAVAAMRNQSPVSSIIKKPTSETYIQIESSAQIQLQSESSKQQSAASQSIAPVAAPSPTPTVSTTLIPPTTVIGTITPQKPSHSPNSNYSDTSSITKPLVLLQLQPTSTTAFEPTIGVMPTSSFSASTTIPVIEKLDIFSKESASVTSSKRQIEPPSQSSSSKPTSPVAGYLKQSINPLNQQRSPVKSFTAVYNQSQVQQEKQSGSGASINSMSPDRKLKKSIVDTKLSEILTQQQNQQPQKREITPKLNHLNSSSTTSQSSPAKLRDNSFNNMMTSPKSTFKLRSAEPTESTISSAKRQSANKFIFNSSNCSITNKERKESQHKQQQYQLQSSSMIEPAGFVDASEQISSYPNSSAASKNTLNQLLGPAHFMKLASTVATGSDSPGAYLTMSSNNTTAAYNNHLLNHDKQIRRSPSEMLQGPSTNMLAGYPAYPDNIGVSSSSQSTTAATKQPLVIPSIFTAKIDLDKFLGASSSSIGPNSTVVTSIATGVNTNNNNNHHHHQNNNNNTSVPANPSTAKISPELTTSSSSPLNDIPSPMTFSQSSSTVSFQNQYSNMPLSYSPLLKSSPLTGNYISQEDTIMINNGIKQVFSERGDLNTPTDTSSKQLTDNQNSNNNNNINVSSSKPTVGLVRIDLDDFTSSLKNKLTVDKLRVPVPVVTSNTNSLSSSFNGVTQPIDALLLSTPAESYYLPLAQQPRNLPRPSPMPIIYDYSMNSSTAGANRKYISPQPALIDASDAKKSLDNSLEISLNQMNHSQSKKSIPISQQTRSKQPSQQTMGGTRSMNNSLAISANTPTISTIRNQSNDRIVEDFVTSSIYSSKTSSFSSFISKSNYVAEMMSPTGANRGKKSGPNTPTADSLAKANNNTGSPYRNSPLNASREAQKQQSRSKQSQYSFKSSFTNSRNSGFKPQQKSSVGLSNSVAAAVNSITTPNTAIIVTPNKTEQHLTYYSLSPPFTGDKNDPASFSKISTDTQIE